MDWQRAAERAIHAYLPAPKDPEAALVAIDPRTGAIRAMVGGRSFERSEFNLATQGRRQAGSAFKPFVLLAALERGISPLELRNGPSSMTIPDPFCETNGKPWTVSNAGDQSAGTMSLENAMAGSVNTIYAQVTVEVGPEAVAEVAHRMGIRSRLSPVCSIGLGTSEVTPLEMTSAFATLAARGIYVEPTAVERVTGRGGEVLQGPLRGLRSVGSAAVSAQDADATTRVLQGVIDHGTGTAARLAGRSAAGKTGTAQDATDAWFCGYVPQLATCVWVGYPQGARPMRDVAGFPEVYGGTIPARIWHDFMTEATAGMPVAGFPPASYEIYADPPHHRRRPLRRRLRQPCRHRPLHQRRRPSPRLRRSRLRLRRSAASGAPAESRAFSVPVTRGSDGAGGAGRAGRQPFSGSLSRAASSSASSTGLGAVASSEVLCSTSRRSVSATSRGARGTSCPQV